MGKDRRERDALLLLWGVSGLATADAADYGDGEAWLCRPEHPNACAADQTLRGDPADPRADDIEGDVVANGAVVAQCGLHLIDVHLAMGNLVELVRTQSAAFTPQPAPPAGVEVGGQ